MTWAQRVGDLLTSAALVVIGLARLFTFLARVLAQKVDELLVALGERSEAGLSRTEASREAWLRLPAAVLWGVAAILLRALSVVTVFLRQLTATVDDFFRVLAEGETGAPTA